MAHGCYSGADKMVVYGIKTEALIAVIGEGDEYFILDVRVIPPKREKPLFQRATHVEWMQSALNRVDAKVRGYGLTL